MKLQRITLTCGRDGRENADESGISTSQKTATSFCKLLWFESWHYQTLKSITRKSIMVKLTKIYTRTGDGGETGIGDGSRVSKLDQRIVAGGAVDEVNAHLGTAAAHCDDESVQSLLYQLQQRLFDLGADLTCPWHSSADAKTALRITAASVTWLEEQVDHANDRLQPLTSFVLPGGSRTAAFLHVARSVCRRAELEALRLNNSAEINPQILIFLNRLSDLLFVIARCANDFGERDVLWTPGMDNA